MSAVYLIRHGQASFGAPNYDVLSERGELQARVLGEAFARTQLRVNAIVCGEMQRHQQTAKACLDAMGRVAKWREDAAWNEFDHEHLINALRPDATDHAQMRAELMAAPDPSRAFQRVFEKAMERWTGGAHDADYAETWLAFRTRCNAALVRIFDALHPRENALVFTSGGPVAAVAQALLRTPDSAAADLIRGLVNGGVTKLVRGRSGIRLSTLNGHAHFEGAHAHLNTYR